MHNILIMLYQLSMLICIKLFVSIFLSLDPAPINYWPLEKQLCILKRNTPLLLILPYIQRISFCLIYYRQVWVLQILLRIPLESFYGYTGALSTFVIKYKRYFASFYFFPRTVLIALFKLWNEIFIFVYPIYVGFRVSFN